MYVLAEEDLHKFFESDKKAVGDRLRKFKEENNLSLSEMDERLGLKKPTINVYIRGNNMAPLSVLEKASGISVKPVDWFYYGENELIRVKNSPKQQVVGNIDRQGSGFKSESFEITWESETRYPDVDVLDEYAYEVFRIKEKKLIR